MNDANDDPLLGLLTDIAEGVAVLAERIDGIEAKISARIDAMETRAATQDATVNEALETIAEIAMRTYYATKPSNELPAVVVNAHVMDRTIERWPEEAIVKPTPKGRVLLQEIALADTKSLDGMIVDLTSLIASSNNGRLRQLATLRALNREIQKRYKTYGQSGEQERERGWSR